MIAARFRTEVRESAWVGELSRSFPDTTFRLLSGMRQGETAVELGESYAEDPPAVAAAADAHPAVLSVQQIEITERRSFTKYETTDTALYEFFERASMPPEFPVTVRNGWSEFDFTGTREGFDRLCALFEEVEGDYELVSVVQSPDGSDLLTDRQREVLRVALRAGYFEVPRECTLADVAGALDVDKSTVSGVLRRGEAKLVKQQLVAAGADHGEG